MATPAKATASPSGAAQVPALEAEAGREQQRQRGGEGDRRARAVPDVVYFVPTFRKTW